MFGVSPLELIIVIFVLGVIVAVIGVGRGFTLPRFGHAMLDCPHCGAETPVHLGKCGQCGKEF